MSLQKLRDQLIIEQNARVDIAHALPDANGQVQPKDFSHWLVASATAFALTSVLAAIDRVLEEEGKAVSLDGAKVATLATVNNAVKGLGGYSSPHWIAMSDKEIADVLSAFDVHLAVTNPEHLNALLTHCTSLHLRGYTYSCTGLVNLIETLKGK